MRKRFGIIIVLLIILGAISSIEVKAIEKLDVLFVSSHNPNHEAFNDQVEGIKEGLDDKVQLQIEYLDFKTFESDENEYNFYNLLKYKLNNYRKFDAIILGDDEALRFGIKYKEELFSDIPIIFLAVNEIELADEAVAKGFIGVVEKESIKDNLKLISQLHPNAKNVVLVKDKAFGNTRDIDEFYSLESKYKNLSFNHISLEDNTFQELTTKLSKLGEDDVVLTLYPHLDKNGVILTQQEAIALIDSCTDSPIYSVSNYALGNGSVGGKVIDQHKLAIKAGEIVKAVLDGKDKAELYINNDSINRYMFDYDKLKQYGIKEDMLPSDSIILNKPIPFREEHSELIGPMSLILIGLVGIIMALAIYSINKTKHEKELLRAKEIAEEANRAKGNFISNISHELRTPISVIMSANQLQKLKINKLNEIRNIEGVNSKEFTPSVNTITQNCYRLLRLVNNIIDVAKVDSGFTDLNLKNVNIVDLIENISLSVLPYAKMKGIEIIFDTTEEEVIMAVDLEKIERIILNLLSNAIKFSKLNGKINVNANFYNDKAIITVEDNGIGISEEHLNKIFDKFVQVDKTLTRQNEGSGIGLSIVKSFVEMHSGNISVESKVDVGTKFIIELPIKIIEESRISEIDSDEESPTILTTKVEFSDIYF